MTLEEFSRDIVPILILGVSTIALLSLFLLWWQIRQTNIWNKLMAQESFLRPIDMDFQKQAIFAAKRIGVNLKMRQIPLTKEEVDKIIGDDEVYMAVTTLLNNMETVALAINSGKVDLDLGLEMHGLLIWHVYTIYTEYIQQIREHYQDHQVYIEIQKIAVFWEARKEQRRKALKKDKLLIAKLLQKWGISKKI